MTMLNLSGIVKSPKESQKRNHSMSRLISLPSSNFYPNSDDIQSSKLPHLTGSIAGISMLRKVEKRVFFET